MGRRTRKKNKKITLDKVYKPNSVKTIMQKVEIFNSSEKWYRKIGRKMLKTGTYKKKDEFTQDFIAGIGDWHVRSNRNPLDDIRNSAFGERELSPHENPAITFNFITGTCSICNFVITYKFPEDYPDEWKFCCSCKNMADEIAKGTLPEEYYLLEKVHTIKKKITLVEENGNRKP